MAEMDLREEVRVAWGTGIAGFVAESGEPVNIPDAYQVIIVVLGFVCISFQTLMQQLPKKNLNSFGY